MGIVDPTVQLSEMMSRLYEYGLTTTSGGNLSIRQGASGLWVTPGSIDKSSLTPESIIAVDGQGTVTGTYKPSIETAFHKGIYEVRDDVKAVVHAHAPATSAFCVHNSAPDVSLIPQIYHDTGPAVLSGYATPGTDWLKDNVVSQAKEGYNAILLDNHGTIAAGASLLEAFQGFEGLEICAAAQIQAAVLGPVVPTEERVHQLISSLLTAEHPTLSKKVDDYASERAELCKMARRAYTRRLFSSAYGSLSLKVDEDRFLITPYGKDRLNLTEDEIVLIDGGSVEQGKRPDLWWEVHRQIFLHKEGVASVMTAIPPSIMAYAITDTLFNSRTLTEGYVVLRDIQKMGIEEVLSNPQSVADRVALDLPVLLVSHGGALSIGKDMVEALDRIEVAEVSMKATLWSQQMGTVIVLDDEKINGIRTEFKF